MLGGDRVREGRFYRVEGEQQARTLAELRDTIEALRQPDQAPLKGIELVIFPDSVAQDHPAVQEIEKWAKRNGLEVALTFPKGTGN